MCLPSHGVTLTGKPCIRILTKSPLKYVPIRGKIMKKTTTSLRSIKEPDRKKTSPPSKEKIPDIHFPIIGIGASAGGLEAFELFFKTMPVDSGMAFVLISHLDPGHASMLSEILQRNTEFTVMILRLGVA